MSGRRRRKLLRQHLLHSGFDLSSQGPEEDHVIHGWLRTDLRREPPPNWTQLLPDAITLGRTIYRSFVAAYARAFLVPDGGGVCQVRRFLSLPWGFVDPHAEEVILTRIRNRRLVLLRHLHGKFQPSLFTAPTFDPAQHCLATSSVLPAEKA